MNKQFIYFAGIMFLAIAATFAVTAQEINAIANNATLNSTILNNTTSANASEETALNIGEASHNAQNLSTAYGRPVEVADISEMAGIAPMVAAVASSAQATGEVASSFKIGTGVGGADPFNPEHVKIDTLALGIPIKSMRDTGKMFFVCDIV